MKRLIFVIVLLVLFGVLYYLKAGYQARMQKPPQVSEIAGVSGVDAEKALKDGLSLVEERKDALALVEFEKVLSVDPKNVDARWGKAEVARRAYKFDEAKAGFESILQENPNHIPSQIGKCYIIFHDEKYVEAMKMAKAISNRIDIDDKNKALAYMLMGSINAKRSQGGFFSKLSYGTQIRNYFQKGVDLAPELPETHLGLGTFYLKAPSIAGGNIDKAIFELETAVSLAPDFATANARLAQAYLKKGNQKKYEVYLARAKELDPENEVLKEIGQ